MTYAPTITTQRLTLRAHRTSDFDAYATAFASERARFMGGPMERRKAWFAFCGDIAQWSLFGHGAWGVERTDDGIFIGQVAIGKPPHFPEVELGWMLCEGAEGHGYAFEAATAARAWAYGEMGRATLVSYIDAENTRSIALAERLGAFIDPTSATPDDENCLVYRHPDPAALQDGGMEAYA
ncbi:MAG: GNAT family N-acetyltransferase [Celeribacter marinus]